MNDDLRDALHRAVDDVEPRRGLDDVLDRADRPRPRRWAPLVVAVAAVVAVITGGTAWVAGQLGEPTKREAPAADAAPSGRTVVATVYFVGETSTGPRLFAEQSRLTGVTDELQSAVEAAVSLSPDDPDYFSFPGGGDGVEANVGRGPDGITIDLHGYTQPADAGAGEEQQMALQALVFTADAAAGERLPVTFTVDGQPVDTLLSTATDAPVAPLADDEALALVSVESPTEGATVDRTFTVTGRANAFEANVVWKLKQGDEVVRQGFTTAEEGSTLSPYSFSVTAPDSGTYTLVVSDTDESDREGFGPSEDSKEIIVR